jgi:hypothetical protein
VLLGSGALDAQLRGARGAFLHVSGAVRCSGPDVFFKRSGDKLLQMTSE